MYRFRLQREYEGNIEFEVSTTCSPCENGNSVVFIDVTTKNTGTRTVSAEPKKYLDGKVLPAYEDSLETIYHSCGLQIKCLDTSYQGSIVYDWYNSSIFKKIDSLPDEINLLGEFELPQKGEIEFWLNAGDICHLGTVITLPPGHYLARVTSIGTHGAPDYCSRIFYFHVDGRSTFKLKNKKADIVT